MVEIGLNSSNYIEIVSGLKEGDVVVLPPVTASTSSGTNQNGNGMGLGALGGGSFGGGSFGGGSFGGGSFGGGNNRQSGTSRQRGN